LASIALAAVTAALVVTLPIRAARWAAPGVDLVETLTRRPVECLDPLGRGRYDVEVGRAVFRTPLLLGGQASRAGLACDSCHTNGRANRNFYFPGLSGAPGTADVTSSLMSSHRDDGIDNPRPIPDLGGDKASLKVSQAAGTRDLERFINGLITEEFDGAQPPPAVVTGLAAYVRALGPAACPSPPTEAVRVGQPIADARRAVRTAIAALARHDGPTAVLLIESARSQLARIDERYGAFPADRSALRIASLDLAAALSVERGSRQSQARLSLIAWLARADAWAADLERDEPGSMYNPDILRQALRS
jgi:hypothetical protein